MKHLLFIISLVLTCQLSAQTTGSFTESITVNFTIHELEYYVPSSYDSSISYPLIVAIHGCGGNATDYRDSFISLADTRDAILVCPNNFGDQLTSAQGNLLVESINKTQDLSYNIDTTAVYLTGFSCNGQETMKQGWNNLYPFRGLIPLNPWVPNLTGYNYANADIPTCICSGTLDASYGNSVSIYDNLILASKPARLNSLTNIGHVSAFANRDTEIMECMAWADSLADPNLGLPGYTEQQDLELQSHIVTKSLIINSTIQQEHVDISLVSIEGKIMQRYTLNSGVNEIDLSGMSSGIYFVKYVIKNKVKAQKIVLNSN